MSTEKENFDPNFTIPDTTVKDPEIVTNASVLLEKYKAKLNFYKWVMGTFIIALITITINYSFNDRAVGLNELSVYEKYATEVLVLNENPKKKRMLAQFFGKAAPSYFIRRQWNKYYDVVDIEYNEYVKKNEDFLKQYKQYLLKPKDSLTDADKFDMDYIKKKLEINLAEENAPIALPEKSILSNSSTEDSAMKKALHFENEGFDAILKKDYVNAKNAFYQSYQLYPTLHNVEEIYKILVAKELKENDWTNFYSQILENYSWGMPNEVKNELKLRVPKNKNETTNQN